MRILFVAFPESIHTARWVNQITDQGWDVHLFPSRSGPLHPDLRNITTYGFSSFRPKGLAASVRWRQLWPLGRGTSRLGIVASRINPKLSDPSIWLARLIRKLKPDIVHSLEFQHASYLTLTAKAHLAKQDFPTWCVSNWGSDIYLFRRLAGHVEKIKAVLENCDFYHCECHRDVELARSLGLKGRVLPVFPVTGGFDTKQMRTFRAPGKTSSRRVIALKGYQNWAGRALVGLRAIELCADVLAGYSVSLYMPYPDVLLAAELVSHSTGIRFDLESDKSTRADILRMHGRARVSIGLSISDAISTSLLEAMVMGSFPVQSNTGCGDEWINCGENGLLVPPESPETVAAALRRALTEDQMVDEAAEINSRLTAERIDVSVVRPQVLEMYKTIAAGGPSSAKRAIAAQQEVVTH